MIANRSELLEFKTWWEKLIVILFSPFQTESQLIYFKTWKLLLLLNEHFLQFQLPVLV